MNNASVTKSVMETYTISANHEHATIALRCWSRPVQRHDGKPDETYYCGEILINSSFGSWANTWTACGCPFKEFLIGADFDYVFTKLMGAKLQTYDGERTVRELRERVISSRRAGTLARDQARDLWDAIEEREMELETSERDYCEGMWSIAGDLDIGEGNRHPMWGDFLEPYYGTKTRYDRQAEGFWRELWPHFTAELRLELKQPPADASVSAHQTRQQ